MTKGERERLEKARGIAREREPYSFVFSFSPLLPHLALTLRRKAVKNAKRNWGEKRRGGEATTSGDGRCSRHRPRGRFSQSVNQDIEN